MSKLEINVNCLIDRMVVLARSNQNMEQEIAEIVSNAMLQAADKLASKLSKQLSITIDVSTPINKVSIVEFEETEQDLAEQASVKLVESIIDSFNLGIRLHT